MWAAGLRGETRAPPTSSSPVWAEVSRRVTAALAPWSSRPPGARAQALITAAQGVERAFGAAAALAEPSGEQDPELAACSRLPAEAAAAALLAAPRLRSRLPRALQAPPAGGDAELRAAWAKAALAALNAQEDAERRARAEAASLAALHAALGRLEEKARALGVLGRALGFGLTTLGLGSDWSEGFVRPGVWDELEALAEEVERSPALRQLAEALGRLDGARPAMAPAPRPWVTPPRDLRPARLAYGDRVATVTPGELALLADPDARLIFELRLAERALLCYSPPTTPPRSRSALGPRGGDRRGPILLCLDRSGSMEGAPSDAARALTLCLARAALSAGRPLRVTQFSAGQMTEWADLSELPAALPALLRLLTRGLSGGTDPRAALRGAVAALDDPRYAQADLLLVSDGRFLPEAETTAALTEAQAARGLRAWALLLPPAGVSDEAAAEAVPWAGRVIVARPETWPTGVWTVVRGVTER